MCNKITCVRLEAASSYKVHAHSISLNTVPEMLTKMLTLNLSLNNVCEMLMKLKQSSQEHVHHCSKVVIKAKKFKYVRTFVKTSWAMKSGDIISLFFGCAGLIFSVATFLWGVYVYRKQQGYSCVCRWQCTAYLSSCFGRPCTAQKRSACPAHFNTSHLHVKEMWVWYAKGLAKTCKIFVDAVTTSQSKI